MVPLRLAALPLWEEACHVFVAGAVGGRGSSRLYRASQVDEVDVHCAQHFVNSSLAQVLIFRGRLKGTRNNGFTQSKWEVLLRYWDAVCRHGPFWSAVGSA